MSYILKIGDKFIGKVDSIRTPELKEVAKQTKNFDFEGWLAMELMKEEYEKIQLWCDNFRTDYLFSLLNPEE
jgi:hypothetical protein